MKHVMSHWPPFEGILLILNVDVFVKKNQLFENELVATK